MTDAELLLLVNRYTLAEFKRAPEAPQYREVLGRFGSWAAAKALCGDWSGLGEQACVYVAGVGGGIVKIGTCPRKTWLLGYPVQVTSAWEGPTLQCIDIEIKMKREGSGLRIDPPQDVVKIGGPNGYYINKS